LWKTFENFAFGGQSGKRETTGVLKMCKIIYRMSKWSVQLYFTFGVNIVY